MELRLLVEAPKHPYADRPFHFSSLSRCPSIRLYGKIWHLTEPIPVNNPASITPFACVSYVWGRRRKPNPIHQGKRMSTCTLTALAAAMRNSTVSAFWIDAFCIPVVEPQRRATLESMGFIYHLAAETIVVLSGAKPTTLQQMQQSDILDHKALLDLAHDEWVTSVWTYQEMVNSEDVRFVSSKHTGDQLGLWCSHWISMQVSKRLYSWLGEAAIDGSHFLDCVGHSLALYREANELNSFDIRKDYPRLDTLEDLIADWLTGTYTQRSAFQVMSNLDRRYTAKPEHYFYSMIGSITKDPFDRAPDMSLADLANTVMRICEQRNDYSFIYSSNVRDQNVGRTWCPKPEPLHSILPWYSLGKSQKGHYDSEGFWLDDMLCLEPSANLEEFEKETIIEQLHIEIPNKANSTDTSIAHLIFSVLQSIGFTGSKVYVPTTHGFFYPQNSLKADASIEVLVATTIRWVFGSPALAKSTSGDTVSFMPGVFIGSIPKENSRHALIDTTAKEPVEIAAKIYFDPPKPDQGGHMRRHAGRKAVFFTLDTNLSPVLGRT